MLISPRPDPAPAAHDRIYRGLRTRIMHGEIAPGQALTLRGIAAEFGVSRERVRQIEVRAFEKVQAAVKTTVARAEQATLEAAY